MTLLDEKVVVALDHHAFAVDHAGFSYLLHELIVGLRTLIDQSQLSEISHLHKIVQVTLEEEDYSEPVDGDYS